MEAVSVVVIIRFASVESRNKPLNREIKIANKRKSTVVAVRGLFVSVYMRINSFGYDVLDLFCLGVFWASFSLIASKIEIKMERRKNYDKETN